MALTNRAIDLENEDIHPARRHAPFSYAARLAASTLGVLLLVAPAGLRAQQPAQDNPYGLTADHVTAVVADLDKESEWYAHVLGFKESSRMSRGDFQACQMVLPGLRIDLVAQKGSTRSKRGGFLDQGWFHIVLKTSKMDELYKSLKANNVAVEGGPNASGVIRSLVTHDPEGNEIEITSN